MQPVSFRAQVPVRDLESHVRHALSLGLPELEWPLDRRGVITVIANGQSAREAPFHKVPTLALNGALMGTCRDARVIPTYWAACDPQELVADFVRDAPEETTYLVASKCAPEVFEALTRRKVILWHVAEPQTWDLVSERLPVRAGPSITCTSLDLMARMGFAAFEFWGWDCCYGSQGQVHAGDPTAGRQPGVDGVVELEVDGRPFLTNPGWAMEAQQAVGGFLPHYACAINGGGLVQALWGQLGHA